MGPGLFPQPRVDSNGRLKEVARVQAVIQRVQGQIDDYGTHTT